MLTEMVYRIGYSIWSNWVDQDYYQIQIELGDEKYGFTSGAYHKKGKDFHRK